MDYDFSAVSNYTEWGDDAIIELALSDETITTSPKLASLIDDARMLIHSAEMLHDAEYIFIVLKADSISFPHYSYKRVHRYRSLKELRKVLSAIAHKFPEALQRRCQALSIQEEKKFLSESIKKDKDDLKEIEKQQDCLFERRAYLEGRVNVDNKRFAALADTEKGDLDMPALGKVENQAEEVRPPESMCEDPVVQKSSLTRRVIVVGDAERFQGEIDQFKKTLIGVPEQPQYRFTHFVYTDRGRTTCQQENCSKCRNYKVVTEKYENERRLAEARKSPEKTPDVDLGYSIKDK
jgi:hypothetical protein